MSLKVYNSLTNKIEEFKTIKEKEVTMYVCGPTVYNYIHIGNARPVIFFDVFRRYLEFLGYKVTYASNITDVDDKIIAQAIKEHVSEKEIASKYAEAFFNDVKALNSKQCDFTPHATDYIPQMITFIQGLIDCGYAYEADGDVYFRVTKLNDYGVLSNQNTEQLESGARIKVNDKKENPLDFTLWKKTTEGIMWDSPFGKGRPGWHTECVCMIDDLFKGMIDVHGGGFDLKFPHHENEIAQSEALHHHKIANYYMHVGRVDLDGEKMSKSKGNVINIPFLQEKGLLEAYRFLICFSHYRVQVNFSLDLLEQFKRDLDKIKRSFKQASLELDLADVSSNEVVESDINSFISYMNDDFNTPNVLTLLLQITKDINVLLRSKDNTNLVLKVNTLKTIFDVFGLKLEYQKMNQETKQIYFDWNEARINKDFAKADLLRGKLVEKGVL